MSLHSHNKSAVICDPLVNRQPYKAQPPLIPRFGDSKVFKMSILYAWNSKQAQSNMMFDKRTPSMYMTMEGKVVPCTSVTQKNQCDLGFTDTIGLGPVYSRCISMSVWCKMSDEQKEAWKLETQIGWNNTPNVLYGWENVDQVWNTNSALVGILEKDRKPVFMNTVSATPEYCHVQGLKCVGPVLGRLLPTTAWTAMNIHERNQWQKTATTCPPGHSS